MLTVQITQWCYDPSGNQKCDAPGENTPPKTQGKQAISEVTVTLSRLEGRRTQRDEFLSGNSAGTKLAP